MATVQLTDKFVHLFRPGLVPASRPTRNCAIKPASAAVAGLEPSAGHLLLQVCRAARQWSADIMAKHGSRITARSCGRTHMAQMSSTKLWQSTLKRPPDLGKADVTGEETGSCTCRGRASASREGEVMGALERMRMQAPRIHIFSCFSTYFPIACRAIAAKGST